MATRLMGALGPFVLQLMQWTSYAERMEEYLLANSVEDNQGQGLFMAINPWLPWFICYILKRIVQWVHSNN